MKNQLNEMKVKWHTFVLRVNEHMQELDATGRQLDRLKVCFIYIIRSIMYKVEVHEKG